MTHPTLRHATLDDIDYILSASKKEFEESPYLGFGVDDSKARKLLEKLIVEGQQKGIVLLSVEEGNPVGVLAAYAFEPLFSSNKIAIECLWFLEEPYRNSRRAGDMIQAYEYWAKAVGCSHVQYGLLSTSPPSMERMYSKIGALETERIFMKAV